MYIVYDRRMWIIIIIIILTTLRVILYYIIVAIRFEEDRDIILSCDLDSGETKMKQTQSDLFFFFDPESTV